MALSKDRKDAIVSEFARSKGDTGSVEVQVALLTERINELKNKDCTYSMTEMI